MSKSNPDDMPAPGSDCSLNMAGEKKKAVGEYISKLGPELRKKYGKQKHYTPRQVQSTASDMNMQLDYMCFAYCMYCSPTDFSLLHAAAGEACDYSAMHSLIGSSFFNGADFEGSSIADVLFTMSTGAANVSGSGIVDLLSTLSTSSADGAIAIAEAAGSVAGSVGDIAGGVFSGLADLLGGLGDL